MLVQKGRTKNLFVWDHAHTKKQLFCAEMKVSTCTNFVVGLSTEEEEEEEDGENWWLSSFPRVTVVDYFEAIIGYRTTPRPGYV